MRPAEGAGWTRLPRWPVNPELADNASLSFSMCPCLCYCEWCWFGIRRTNRGGDKAQSEFHARYRISSWNRIGHFTPRCELVFKSFVFYRRAIKMKWANGRVERSVECTINQVQLRLSEINMWEAAHPKLADHSGPESLAPQKQTHVRSMEALILFIICII